MSDTAYSILPPDKGPVELSCHFCHKPLLLWKTKSGDYTVGCPRCMGDRQHVSYLTGGTAEEALSDLLDYPILGTNVSEEEILAKKASFREQMSQEGLDDWFFGREVTTQPHKEANQ